MPDQTQQETPPERLPCDAEIIKRAAEFGAAAVADIPELRGVVVIPVWINPPEQAPPGILHFRDQTPILTALTELLRRLAMLGSQMQVEIVRQLQGYDDYAKQLADTIKERAEILAELDQQAQPQQQNPNQ